MRVALITAIYGGMDIQKQIPEQSIPFDYYFYSEKSGGYSLSSLNNRMKAKYFKCQAHRVLPDYDAYIWLDGSVQIDSHDFVKIMTEQLVGQSVAMTRHPTRTCIYDEISYIEKVSPLNTYFSSRYENLSVLRDEVEGFRKKGYPEQNGLFACGIFIRRNNYMTNIAYDEWWNSCLTGTYFDQTSFCYSMWKHRIKPHPIDQVMLMKHYHLVNHLKEQ